MLLTTVDTRGINDLDLWNNIKLVCIMYRLTHKQGELQCQLKLIGLNAIPETKK